MSDPLLEADGLVRHFDGLRAVDHVSFQIAEGSVTGLIGPNGAGKTTVFNLLSGSLTREHGRIRFAGNDLTRAAPHRVAQHGLIRTFQQPRALTRMTVRENLQLAAQGHPGERLHRLLVPWSYRDREEEIGRRADELLRLVDLDHLSGDYAGTLSGGQRKLLELARALMARPRMVLLDEPLAGVNPTLGRRLEQLVASLREDHGLTVLLIEHDMPAVMRLCDRVIVMSGGRVIADGPPAQVQNDPAVIDAYLGTHGSGPDTPEVGTS